MKHNARRATRMDRVSARGTTVAVSHASEVSHVDALVDRNVSRTGCLR